MLVSLALAGCDPELYLGTAGTHLLVGQKGRIKVLEGGEGAELVANSLKLTDSLTRTYTAQQLQAKAISNDEVELAVPTGIAPGTASIEVRTAAGFIFKDVLQITRLAAMRDLSGKVWMLALPEAGSMNQYLDIAPGTKGMGKTAGQVAISPDGKLLASSSRSIWRIYLAWTGDHPMTNFVQLTREIIDLTVTSTGHTLAATDSGTYYIERPTSRTAALKLGKSALGTGDTLAVASARSAKVAVALSAPKTGSTTYKLYRIGLSGAQPAIETQDDVSWTTSKGSRFDLALSHDGTMALATDKAANRVVLLRKGGGNVTLNLASGQSGPISVAAGPGGMFYVLNETSKNVSVVTASGSTLKLQNVISLGLSSASGLPLELSMSGNDELVVLAQRDVVLIDAKTAKASVIKFTNLFTNKTKGEIGGSIAIQP